MLESQTGTDNNATIDLLTSRNSRTGKQGEFLAEIYI